MSKNKGFAIALAIVVGIAIAIWNSPVIQEPFEKADVYAAQSLVLSLHTAASGMEMGGTQSTWRLLTDDEYSRLVRSAQSNGRLDVSSKDQVNAECVVDNWGTRLYVATRRTNSKSQFIVMSSGPDKTAGTEDDIVIPENFREDMAKLVKN